MKVVSIESLIYHIRLDMDANKDKRNKLACKAAMIMSGAGFDKIMREIRELATEYAELEERFNELNEQL